jgi:WD40 repeat protein
VVASAGEDKIIYVWPANGKSNFKSLKGTHTINCFCFINKDQYILSGGDEGVIKYWKIATEELIHNIAFHSMPIRSIISNDDSA